MLGGVKASTPAARSLLDPACAPGEERDAATAWLDGTRGLIEPVLAGSAALGFVGERGLAAARRGYSDAHLKRLAAIKNRVDPDDRFRFNIGTALK